MNKVLLTVFVTVLIATAAYAEEMNSDLLVRRALSSGKPSIIDFGAKYCKSCKKMKPILDSLAVEYQGKANVIFVDVKEEQDVPGKYHIQMIPTQVFFDRSGKEVKRHMGFMDKAAIQANLQELGVK